MMRHVHLLALFVLIASIGFSLALFEAPIERINLPEGVSYKRYLSDPLARNSVLYAGLLQIGGQNYRLILVRLHFNALELTTARLKEVENSGCHPLPLTRPLS